MAENRAKISPRTQRETFTRLDGRGHMARQVKSIREALTDSLGGEEHVSPQEALLIEQTAIRAVRCRMFALQWLQKGKISEEMERRWNWHANGLRRDLQALGLQRRQKPVETLDELVQRKYGTDDG